MLPTRQGNASELDFRLYTSFYYHIVKNGTAQDGVAFVSMVEAVLHQLRKVTPNASEFWLLYDKDSCYRNNLLPDIASFLAKGVGSNLKGIVHSETKRGKSIVHGHFAVAVRQVNMFVNDMTLSMSTPGHLVTA